jgi:hypothetical protein
MARNRVRATAVLLRLFYGSGSAAAAELYSTLRKFQSFGTSIIGYMGWQQGPNRRIIARWPTGLCRAARVA